MAPRLLPLALCCTATMIGCLDWAAPDLSLGETKDRAARNCAELHAQRPSLTSGIYWTLDVDETPTPVYCDMETSDGGWTALINPVDPALLGTHPDVVFDGEAVPGDGSCAATPLMFTADDWRGIRAYVCGSDTVTVMLSWLGEADDVMFLATAQGQETHTVTVNGIDIPPDALTDDYMQCAFWNEDGDRVFPEDNACWSTTLTDSTPHTELDVLDGDGLDLILEAGPSCSPDCLHGTGLNITQLFVR